MCSAGLEPADHHVGATFDPTRSFTPTVFNAHTSSARGGDAAHHGARLVITTAMYVAMLRSTALCVGGAAMKLALPCSAMLVADTTCYCNSAAVYYLAHFCVATAMLRADSFFG